ncbi:MAG: hypothetical protein JWM85_1811 [Acidimicrobiaceae bacterium]|nr:hypothetical protein [Acidimicrobiaceae bacterium]
MTEKGTAADAQNDFVVILSSPKQNRWPRLLARHRFAFFPVAWLNATVPGFKGRLTRLLVSTKGQRIAGGTASQGHSSTLS